MEIKICETVFVREREKAASNVGKFVGTTGKVIVTGYVAMVLLMDSK